MSALRYLLTICVFLIPSVVFAKIPIGINIDAVNYYSPAVPFNDLMKTASKMISYPHGTYEWNSGKMEQIPVDENGWPLQLPFTVDGTPQDARFLINNHIASEYVVLHDGEGTIEFEAGESRLVDGVLHITLTGEGGHRWLNITSSTHDNHIRNMRIIPIGYKNNEQVIPVFRDDFIQGLQPFHVLRFLDFGNINNSKQVEWSDRNTRSTYTQGNGKGVAWEYMIELSNRLEADAWILAPHMASDDYLTRLAQLLLNTLDSERKLYIEFSNEVWNWMFSQSHYVLENAPNHPNPYVSAGLAAINPNAQGHPEKDAYMMARLFRIFSGVWGAQSDRLIRVATGQQAWVDNSRRILEYLFTTDGIGADAFSVAGYFGYDKADHDVWVAMNPDDVTPEMILASAAQFMPPDYENIGTRQSAAYAAQYGVDYIVYEGGQHMQPHNQEEWAYNHAIYDAQIHPGMYDLYMQNFTVHEDPAVNCKLFMAYSYVGERESRWGSWGHLENLNQVNAPDLRTIAPKYQALLDINAPTTSFTVNCTELACDFDAGAGTDADGSIVSYAWDFGDGYTGTSVTVLHNYSIGGSYTVILTVTDNAGVTSTATQNVIVSSISSTTPPTASFTVTCTELACAFDASASRDADGSIVSYAWDFGDGDTGTGVTVSHTYSIGGNYTVVLTVTDNAGVMDTATHNVTISNGGATTTGIQIISPVDGSIVTAGQPFMVQTSVNFPENVQEVTFWHDGWDYFGSVTSAPYEMLMSEALTGDNPHLIRVRVTYNDTSTEEHVVYVNTGATTTGIQIISPADGSIVTAGQPFMVQTSVNFPENVQEVTFWHDGWDYFGSVTSAPYEMLMSEALTGDNPHLIRVRVTYNDTSTEEHVVYVNTGATTTGIQIISPADGSIVTAGQPFMVQTSVNFPENVQEVTFWHDGWDYFGSVTSAPYEMLMSEALTGDNPHLIRVRVTYNDTSTEEHVVYVNTDATTQPVTVINNRISTSSDDVEEALASGELYLNSSDMELGDDPTNNGTQTVGLRFQSVNIPQGVTIVTAYLEFVVDETGSTATNVEIQAQAADNAPAFAANNKDVTNRALTSAATAWDIPAWNRVGDIKQSPDVSAVVQEVVNRAGWTTNNDMVFVISGTGKRTAEAYDGVSSAAPLLHVEYSSGVAP